MSDSPSPWATLELKVKSDTSEIAQESLDTFAYLLAECEGVGGVETRDGGPELIHELSVADPSLPSPQDPSREDMASWFGEMKGVIAYTTPMHLETLRASAHRIAASLGLSFDARVRERTDDSWRDAWKQFYQPMEFGGGQLRISPSWIEQDAEAASRTLVLDPGRAFGTGLHESTRLCLEHLATWQASELGSTLLDLGCGSGILGLAALRLFGAQLSRVWLVDIEEQAVQTAQENASLNGLCESKLNFLCSTAPALTLPCKVDTIFANIRPQVLLPDAPSIRAMLAPEGTLLLSGILDEEADDVIGRYQALGLSVDASTQLRGWTAIQMRAPA